MQEQEDIFLISFEIYVINYFKLKFLKAYLHISPVTDRECRALPSKSLKLHRFPENLEVTSSYLSIQKLYSRDLCFFLFAVTTTPCIEQLLKITFTF